MTKPGNLSGKGPRGVVLRGAILLSVAVVLIGFCISFFVSSRLRLDEMVVAEKDFESHSVRLAREVTRRIDSSLFGLMGVRVLFMGSHTIVGNEFRASVSPTDLHEEYSDALGFGYIERVMREDLDEYVAKVRADSSPGFAVRSAGDAPDLYVVRFIEPLERNYPALGYDVGSEPVRRESVEKAIRTGKPTLTPQIHLVQDNRERAGFLYLLPIYQRGTSPGTPEEREAALRGLAYTPIILDLSMEGISQFGEEMLDFRIFDGDTVDEAHRIFALGGSGPSGAGAASLFATRETISMGGRTWTLAIASTPRFDRTVTSATPMVVGVGGAVLSLLLAAVIWALGMGRSRAVRLAIELRESRDQAEAANRAKSDFLANMSHEIRTPLTAILGYADILVEDRGDGGASTRGVDAVMTIRRSGDHLLAIVNDLLDLSKIEAGKLAIESTDTSLVKVLRELDAIIHPQALEHALDFRIVFETPIPDRIVSDPTRLRQILINLAGNAVKFTEAGSIVVRGSVAGSPGGQILRFEIEDTGPGLTPEEESRLFNPFTQADNSVTRKFGGTGLGLSISRQLARMMGGDIRIDYTEPGKGTRFVFESPLVEVSGAALVSSIDSVCDSTLPAASLRAGAAGEKPLAGRVLLAEDNPINQELIAYHIRNVGATVEFAEDGRIALERIDQAHAAGQPYDLLVSDMQMPVMDGYTLAATLRSRGNRIPIVALTAHAMSEDRQRCMDAGCDDYGVKPIDKAKLIEICSRWIGR